MSMKKYMRLYLATINHPTKEKLYYVGKHESKYEDAAKDPYTGSGILITNIKKKYGEDVVSMQWFDTAASTTSELIEYEYELINAFAKIHGERLLNIDMNQSTYASFYDNSFVEGIRQFDAVSYDEHNNIVKLKFGKGKRRIVVPLHELHKTTEKHLSTTSPVYAKGRKTNLKRAANLKSLEGSYYSGIVKSQDESNSITIDVAKTDSDISGFIYFNNGSRYQVVQNFKIAA